MQVDLANLGFDEGGHLLVKRALRGAGEIRVTGIAPELESHLRAWCRSEGHSFHWLPDSQAFIIRGDAEAARWTGSERAAVSVAEHAPRKWELAARGARVEAGSPEFGFTLVDKIEVWSPGAARIYAQAAAVQIMTYLIENETAALIIPSRFIAQLHPQFREVMQVLAIQAADEARHIEVFTRRAMLKRSDLGL